MLSGSPPYVYIYILSHRDNHTYTHTDIYIYFKPHNASTQPSQPQQPAAAAAAAGCCYTFEEMEEMQASANVPIRDIYKSIYIIYIYMKIYIGLSFKWDIQDWWEI